MASEVKHSPTPWHWNGTTQQVEDAAGSAVVVSGFMVSGAADDGAAQQIDARIMRAVNAHDALVEVLRASEVELHLECGDRCTDLLAKIRAALYLASCP